MPTASFTFEKKFWPNRVIGVDEVGRGCLAGPIVAGAVMFSPDHKRIHNVFDSKTLKKETRAILSPQLIAQCLGYGIGEASVHEIDTLGLSQALSLAMQRAIQKVTNTNQFVLLIDGNVIPRFTAITPAEIHTIVKGDQKSYSIAAASILAKVHRDELMHSLAKQYHVYGWHNNVGYGTKEHQSAIVKHGMTPQHRKLFCRKLSTNIMEQSSAAS